MAGIPKPFEIKMPTPKGYGGLRDIAREGFAPIFEGFVEFCSELTDKVLPETMYDALEPTFEKSQELVPVDTGELKDSGYLDIVDRKGGARVEIGYGRGGAQSYALMVHERTDIHHQAPTQAKFLQQPLDEDYFNILTRIASGVKRQTKL